MKRPLEIQTRIDGGDMKMKKVKEPDKEEEQQETEPKGKSGNGFSSLGEDLLFEVLKHADARTLARAACVSKLWKKTALDERLWELICTRQWANIGCGNQRLRSVVLALGGFRRLHLWPLLKPSAGGPSGRAPSPWIIGGKQPTSWGKDQVHLSLSLLSIRYYEKMDFSNRGR